MSSKPITKKTCLTNFNSDLMRETVQGADFEHYQLGEGAFFGKLFRLELTGLCIDYGHYSLGVSSRGVTSKNSYTIGMLLRPDAQGHLFKAKIRPGNMVFEPPGAEINVCLIGQPCWCTLSFEKNFFEEAYYKRVGHKHSDKDLQQAAIIETCADTSRLIKMVKSVLLAQQRKYTSLLCKQLSEKLMDISLSGLLTGKRTSTRKKNSRRSQIIAIAEKRLNEISTPISVADLARDLKVSVRTLEYAFKDLFGITPKRYLTIRRLNFVRQQLLREPTKTITHHASQAGFWHMAQFSVDYKTLFGETPSETIKKLKKQF